MSSYITFMDCPNCFYISPNPLASEETLIAVEQHRISLEENIHLIPPADSPLEPRDAAAVYCEHFGTWERALIDHHKIENGVLLHFATMVDRGYCDYYTDVRPIPNYHLRGLDYVAVRVELAGLRPTGRDWCNEAFEFAMGLVELKVEVSYVGRNNNIVKDLTIFPNEGEPYSWRRYLVQRHWADDFGIVEPRYVPPPPLPDSDSEPDR